MSSRFSSTILLFILALSTPMVGCGKKGPPLPPTRVIPQAATDFTVAQRGGELALAVGYPTMTVSGTALPPLARVEVWEIKRPVAADKLRLSTYRTQIMKPLDPREFAEAAERLIVFQGDDLQRVTAGDRIVARLPLASSPEPEVRYLAVRTAVDERDVSDFSNQAVFFPRAQPKPPAKLGAVAGPVGIEIGWDLGDDGAPAAPIEGFNVYRRDPRSRSWGEALAFVSREERTYLDPDAVQGRSYIYTVTTVTSREPLVESLPGGAQEVDYRDLFPPPVPAGLVALRDQGKVRLVWQESRSLDLAGYRLYRRREGEEFRRLNDQPISSLEFEDADVSSGETVFYSLTAIDELGNESAPAEEILVEVP